MPVPGVDWARALVAQRWAARLTQGVNAAYAEITQEQRGYSNYAPRAWGGMRNFKVMQGDTMLAAFPP